MDEYAQPFPFADLHSKESGDLTLGQTGNGKSKAHGLDLQGGVFVRIREAFITRSCFRNMMGLFFSWNPANSWPNVLLASNCLPKNKDML